MIVRQLTEREMQLIKDNPNKNLKELGIGRQNNLLDFIEDGGQ